MSTGEILTPQLSTFKKSQKKFGKIRFGMFRSKTNETKLKKTNKKQGKFKKALRKKLKNRSRKEKSAITALIVLSSNKSNENCKNKNPETKEEQVQETKNLQKKNEFLTHKEPNSNLRPTLEQKEQEVNLNSLRSLYSKYEKPKALKKNTHEPSVQQPFGGYKSTILTHLEVPISEDTTSTYDQLEGQSYDDSFSEDIVSFSDEESEMGNDNKHSHFQSQSESNFDEVQYYTASDEEMESIGDEITIQFGINESMTNTHQLISPQNYSFVSQAFGKTSSYPKHLMYCDYNNVNNN
ncbi:hypothetical protein M0812_28865 [Anaeramoeba flamelloides]|uniref:Uncharacterized protein n=1 Tax=Anaeramoeba flamelloides TaxID=1746091 RepID=A0AAV7YCS4_9EUKA|nr:hypothetical protein M0812_28865 [Anaeramoeba flamelloides]|eukprot:Anaeramoba_flamelloidesa1055921_401.p1 GENE.a1055921_401~~a1055921_401.p1  ORF type:complete len:321 (+),score=88.34 a1055921_401:81-965(+)